MMVVILYISVFVFVRQLQFLHRRCKNCNWRATYRIGRTAYGISDVTQTNKLLRPICEDPVLKICMVIWCQRAFFTHEEEGGPL